MKNLFYLLFVPVLAQASFSKPELLARFMYSNAYKAPDNFWCFGGEPGVLKSEVFLDCMDLEGSLMARWKEGEFEIVARAQEEHYFSRPTVSLGRMTWYESSELEVDRFFIFQNDELTETKVQASRQLDEVKDSFLPLTPDSHFFKTKGEETQLWIWKNDVVTPFFNPQSAFLFSPQIGRTGEVALKARDLHLGEGAPDKIWFYDGQWRVVLEDQNANPMSPWKSFRHQLSIDGKKILVIASDAQGEALILVEDGKTKILARAGVDLARFDYFSPKISGGTIAFRGEDFDDRKATYVVDETGVRKLLAENDIVQTDLGPGRVFYEVKDALFYGAPGIDEEGNVVLQATLTDPDYPTTLLGVGLIRFTKE